MSWGPSEWVTRVRVRESKINIFRLLVFHSLRKIEVWTNKGRHLSNGYDGETHTHEISRPRCKLSYFTGGKGLVIDHLNAVWEC